MPMYKLYHGIEDGTGNVHRIVEFSLFIILYSFYLTRKHTFEPDDGENIVEMRFEHSQILRRSAKRKWTRTICRETPCCVGNEENTDVQFGLLKKSRPINIDMVLCAFKNANAKCSKYSRLIVFFFFFRHSFVRRQTRDKLSRGKSGQPEISRATLELLDDK